MCDPQTPRSSFWPTLTSSEMTPRDGYKAPEFSPEVLEQATLLGLMTCAFASDATFEPYYVLRGYLDAAGLSGVLEIPLSVLRQRITIGESRG